MSMMLVLTDATIVLVVENIVLYASRLTWLAIFAELARGMADDGNDLVVAAPVFSIQEPALGLSVPGFLPAHFDKTGLVMLLV